MFSEKIRRPNAASLRKSWAPFGDALTSSDNSTRTVTSQENIFIADPKVSVCSYLPCIVMQDVL